eukprot:m.100001 g.100001  ORF g.100001 m.100001 type:complete len:444 (+) comp10329_c0_seq3:48-1379(+)
MLVPTPTTMLQRWIALVATLLCMGDTDVFASSLEDPFIFQRPDGSLHCIYHGGPDSFHAYSADGVTWTAPSTVAFNTTLATSGASAQVTAARTTHDATRHNVTRTSCATDADCSLLGTCQAGACHCAPGFTGTQCGQLDLVPATSLSAATLWPQPNVPNVSSWGFTVAYDPNDSLYHAVTTVSCGCNAGSPVHACSEYTGVLASGGYASSLVHLTSTRPDGGFVYAGVLAPSTSFNPQLVRSPNGTFALYFRVNSVAALPLCTGDPSGPSSSAGSLIKVCTGPTQDNCIHAGNPEHGTNMYVATATSMKGPWKVASVDVTGEGGLHVSNPSVTFIKPGTPASKLGVVAMAFRYNAQRGEANGIAFANDPAGPFRAVANLTQTPGPEATAYHGSAVQLKRRERPSMLMDPSTGNPVMLYNGASSNDASGVYRAYSLVQRFATSS